MHKDLDKSLERMKKTELIEEVSGLQSKIKSLESWIGLDTSNLVIPGGRDIHNVEDLQDAIKQFEIKNIYNEIVHSVTQSVHQSLNLHDVLDYAVDSISKNIESAMHTTIYFVENDEAVMQTHRGFTDEYLKRAERIPKPKGLIWKTIVDKRVRYIPDVDKDDAIGKAGKDMGIKSYLSVPIFDEISVIGVLALTSSLKNGFTEDDLGLTEIVAQQLQSAILNAKKVELLKRKTKHESIINTITQSVHSSINLDEVLENAVESIKTNLDQSVHVSIYFAEHDKAILKTHRGYPDWFIEIVKAIPKPKGFTWKTITEGETLYCPNVDLDTTIGPAGRKVGTKSYVAVPLISEEVVFGSLNIHSFKKNAFNKDDIEVLEIVANQISVAVANARKTNELKIYASKLEESNKELQQFAYVASHDLQEPLRMVGSYLGLLERRYKDKLDQDANDFIFYAVDGAKRMQNLINDLLSYSRVSTKAKPFKAANTKKIVEVALKNLEVLIEESGAEIIYKDLPEEIFVDPTQVGQLIQNLISNSIKFCDNSVPKVEITAMDKGNEWQLAIKDNGIGIAPEYHERIFDIFQRLHGKSEYPGTGIGLSICKKIVERHGGKIWVESKQGSGSTFFFTIAKLDGGNEIGYR